MTNGMKLQITIWRKGEILKHYPMVDRVVVTADRTLQIYIIDMNDEYVIHTYRFEQDYTWFEVESIR